MDLVIQVNWYGVRVLTFIVYPMNLSCTFNIRGREEPDKALSPLKQVLRKLVPLLGCCGCGSSFWLSNFSVFDKDRKSVV